MPGVVVHAAPPATADLGNMLGSIGRRPAHGITRAVDTSGK